MHRKILNTGFGFARIQIKGIRVSEGLLYSTLAFNWQSILLTGQSINLSAYKLCSIFPILFLKSNLNFSNSTYYSYFWKIIIL